MVFPVINFYHFSICYCKYRCSRIHCPIYSWVTMIAIGIAIWFCVSIEYCNKSIFLVIWIMVVKVRGKTVSASERWADCKTTLGKTVFIIKV